MSIEFTNLLRISVVVMGAYILVIMGIIILIYCKNLRTCPDKNRRILTGHIVLIGFSYAILVGSSMYEMMLRYGLAMTWRTPTCAVSLLIGVLAMHLMLWRLILMRRIHPK